MQFPSSVQVLPITKAIRKAVADRCDAIFHPEYGDWPEGFVHHPLNIREGDDFMSSADVRNTLKRLDPTKPIICFHLREVVPARYREDIRPAGMFDLIYNCTEAEFLSPTFWDEVEETWIP